MKTPGKMWWMTSKQAELRFAGEITWHLIQALSSGLALDKLLRPLWASVSSSTKWKDGDVFLLGCQ